MYEIRRWYKTLELAAHCMCEQGYDVRNLIKIAKHIEKTSGIKPNPTVTEIRKTIDFHVNLERQERKQMNLRAKEQRLIRKHEEKFQVLPVSVQSEMIRENEGIYWKAVEVYAKKGKRYVESVNKKLTQKQEEYHD